MEKRKIDLSVGVDLIETLTSALYSDPIVVFREYVQNSVDNFKDTKAERLLEVLISVDLKKRRIVIDDNGSGIEKNRFSSTMQSLGKSAKRGRQSQIGFKGIGRLAGLAFCDKLIFTNKSTGQQFVWDGKKYRQLLNDPSRKTQDLEKALPAITSEDNIRECGVGFRVEMVDITDELIQTMTVQRRGRGRRGALSSKDFVSDLFISRLEHLLPLPYSDKFDKRDEIHSAYQKLFSQSLESQEFVIKFNGKVLAKSIESIGDRAFIKFPVFFSSDDGSVEKPIVGLMWLSFDFLMHSVGDTFGVAVRSRNMLVNDGPIFASEASQSPASITSYGQYLAASKGLYGELLLDTKLLSDNSSRDWFRLDSYALQLREQICSVMNAVHQYRYAMSKYHNCDQRSADLRNNVIAAYQRIQQCGSAIELEAVYPYLERIDKTKEKYIVDERADETDIYGYSKAQKSFYRDLMMLMYEYYKNLGSLTFYYELKSYLVKRLNDSSNT